MSGRNVNIYLQTEIFDEIRNITKKGKVSSFISGILQKEIEIIKKTAKQKFQNSLIEEYKLRSQNRNFQKEMNNYENASWGDFHCRNLK